MPCLRHGNLCGDPPPLLQCPVDGFHYIVRRQLGKGGFAQVYAVTRLPHHHALVTSYQQQQSIRHDSSNCDVNITTSSTTSSSPSSSVSTSLNALPHVALPTTPSTSSSPFSSQIFADIVPPTPPQPLPSLPLSPSHHRSSPSQSRSQSRSHSHSRSHSRSHSHSHRQPSTHSPLNQNFALKVISKCRVASTSAGRHALRSEVLIHSRLRHPSIISLLTFWEDQHRVYLLLDLVEGPSLNTHLRSRRRLTELEAALYLSQTLEALSYLHANNVVHKDVKLANLLLSPDLSRIHLCDFGLSAFVDAESQAHLSPVCGTPNYVAPELLTSSSLASRRKEGNEEQQLGPRDVVYTAGVDIWSMGIVMFSVLVGHGPFDGDDVNRTFRRIRTARFTFPIGLRLSVPAKSLVRSLLAEDPSKRPSADEALHHKFFALAMSGHERKHSSFAANNTTKAMRATAKKISALRGGDRCNVNTNANAGVSINVSGHGNGNGIGFRRARAIRERERLEKGLGNNAYREPDRVIHRVPVSSDVGTAKTVAFSDESGLSRERDRGRDRDRGKDRNIRRGKRSPSLVDESASEWRKHEDGSVGRPTYDRAASLTSSRASARGYSNVNNNRHSTNSSNGSGNHISGTFIANSRDHHDGYKSSSGRRRDGNCKHRASWTTANGIRQEVVNLCVSVSAALVKARQLLDEDREKNDKNAGLKRAEEVCDEVDSTMGAPRMVRRWLDYTTKYGFATMMDDGLVGCCFNDGAIMMMSESDGGVPNVGYIGGMYEKDENKNDVSEKVCLCKMFAGLMLTADVGGRGGGVSAATLSGLPSAFNMSLLPRDEDAMGIATSSNKVAEDGENVARLTMSRKLVHVREWARLRHRRAAAFRLSNHSVHVKFDLADDMCDDFVFDLQRKTVFYRQAKAATARVCRFCHLACLGSLSETVYNEMVVCSQALNRFLD